MNDEPFFEPFPFDFDFLESFPLDDFTLANDPGFPRVWENIPDWFGRGLSIFEFVGEVILELWGWVWSGIGGGLRWVWERLDDTLDWLWRQLIHVRESIFQWGDWWFNWLWSRADWAARGIYGGVRGAFDWLHGKVAWWGGTVRDWVEDWAEWLWSTASWGARGIYGGVRGAFDWLHGKVAWWGGTVRDWVQDWAEWLWSTASWGAKGIYGGVRGAFDWLHDKVAWWGGAVRDWVQDWAEWTWSKASDAAGRFTGGLTGGLGWVVENVGDAADGVTGFVGDLLGGLIDKLGDIFMPMFEFLGGGIRDVGHFLVEGAWEPATEFFDRKLDVVRRLYRGEFDTFDDLWTAALNPPIAPLLIVAAFFGLLALNALNVTTSAIIQESIEPMVQRHRATIGTRTLFVTEARDLLLRDFIDQDGFVDHLGRQGYSEDNARNLMALAQPLPGSSDLIRMGVREVFTPEIAEEFGQFEDFPVRFGEVMDLAGYGLRPTGEIAGGGPGGGRTWAEAFWAAHWDLPSITQGFEMYHREVTLPDGSTFDEPKLMLLLRALDVMPHWRDPLRQIAYRVVTRVDIRRLYQDGIVDEDKVREVYRHLGYRPEDADGLTEMVKIRYARGGKGEGTDLRELTMSTIKQAYVRRLVDRDEALEKLLALDHPEEDAELILSIWDFDLAQDPDQRSDIGLRELSASVIERAYERRLFDFNRALVELIELGYTQEDAEIKLHLVDFRMAEDLTELQIDGALNDLEAGLISSTEVESRLGEFGLPEERIDYLLQRELLRRQVKTRRLTVSQLLRARAAGHIASDDELLDRIVTLGYNERDASILVKMA